MIRVLGVFCFGLLGFTCIANYHVSEETRIARQELARTEKQIKAETQNISVLEAQWQKVANPDAIQKMAENQLGMQSAPSVQLASVQELPRKADTLNANEVRSGDSENVPVPVMKASLRSGM